MNKKKIFLFSFKKKKKKKENSRLFNFFFFIYFPGYNAEIPGLPRYSYIGDRKIGVYNLKITNVTLEDDSEFQCQVGPVANNKAIRANARLTVIGIYLYMNYYYYLYIFSLFRRFFSYK